MLKQLCTLCNKKYFAITITACKVSKYGVISGPNTGKYRREVTPYLDTFHAVKSQKTQKRIHATSRM